MHTNTHARAHPPTHPNTLSNHAFCVHFHFLPIWKSFEGRNLKLFVPDRGMFSNMQTFSESRRNLKKWDPWISGTRHLTHCYLACISGILQTLSALSAPFHIAMLKSPDHGNLRENESIWLTFHNYSPSWQGGHSTGAADLIVPMAKKQGEMNVWALLITLYHIVQDLSSGNVTPSGRALPTQLMQSK